jgi:hypothetical protein
LTEEGKRKYKLIALKTKMHNSIFDLGAGVLVGGGNRRGESRTGCQSERHYGTAQEIRGGDRFTRKNASNVIQAKIF